MGIQRHAPAALPPEKTRYPLYRRLGGLQSRSRRVRKISHPPGFDPRTIQPVVSRYTDCAIPAPPGRFSTRKDSPYLWYRRLCGAGLDGREEKIFPHRGSNPDRPTCIDSLYLLRCPTLFEIRMEIITLLGMLLRFQRSRVRLMLPQSNSTHTNPDKYRPA